mmetsp:Transcript_20138/g.59804  ORF Transcript_20138/g.59804 Transcript_20138/m.59804 type:complete len:224 (+) Transcript_20138:266-937(+)
MCTFPPSSSRGAPSRASSRSCPRPRSSTRCGCCWARLSRAHSLGCGSRFHGGSHPTASQWRSPSPTAASRSATCLLRPSPLRASPCRARLGCAAGSGSSFWRARRPCCWRWQCCGCCRRSQRKQPSWGRGSARGCRCASAAHMAPGAALARHLRRRAARTLLAAPTPMRSHCCRSTCPARERPHGWARRPRRPCGPTCARRSPIALCGTSGRLNSCATSLALA